MTRRFLLPVAVLVALAAADPLLAQCAMCKTVLMNSAEGRRISEGLNHGIVLMFAAPYLIFGAFAAAVFRRQLRLALSRWRRDRGTLVASLPAGLASGD